LTLKYHLVQYSPECFDAMVISCKAGVKEYYKETL